MHFHMSVKAMKPPLVLLFLSRKSVI